MKSRQQDYHIKPFQKYPIDYEIISDNIKNTNKKLKTFL